MQNKQNNIYLSIIERVIELPIPQLKKNGFLPKGIYTCTMEEVKDCFTTIDDINIRSNLYKRLQDYYSKLEKLRVPGILIIDGSFVSRKEEPSDIDIGVMTPFDWINNSSDCLMYLNADYIKMKYNFHFIWGFVESFSGDAITDGYQQVKDHPKLKKGILKVML